MKCPKCGQVHPVPQPQGPGSMAAEASKNHGKPRPWKGAWIK